MPVVVSDSSPLVYLTRLGRFELLRQIYGEVLIPSAVWQEVAVAGAGFPEGGTVRQAVADGWLVPVSAGAVRPSIAASIAGLGDAEREAIQLALERGAMLIVDEADGRQAAMLLGIPTTGTVGVLIEARLRRLITTLKPELDRLRSTTNFRLSDPVYHRALAAVNE